MTSSVFDLETKDAFILATMWAQSMAWRYFPDDGELVAGLIAAGMFCVYRAVLEFTARRSIPDNG